MALIIEPLVCPLFVPASRPDRYVKAAQSGADAIIIDLEDAIAAKEKQGARDALASYDLRGLPVRVFVRINPIGSDWIAEDLAVVARLAVAGVMLPKISRAEDLHVLQDKLGEAIPIIGLVESAMGIARLPEIAAVRGLFQLAFGSIDFALDIGAQHERESLILARTGMVLHSRAADLPAPLDGVTAAIGDNAATADDATYAARIGFGGKLAIHPAQVDAIRGAFRPNEAEIKLARRIIAAEEAAGGEAVQMDGMMIDAPVCARARRLLARIP
ncbi:HpcH/HpaI aldolase/citrate lyase family protein (plasmid) [Rhizobium leguminosarum]